jgi:hypothetical protein
MRRGPWLALVVFLAPVALAEVLPDAAPLPEASVLLEGLAQRQRHYEQALDDYTYNVLETEQQVDGAGRVKKTELRGYEVFFVNGHAVRQQVSRDGQRLDERAARKEGERARREAEELRGRPREKRPGEVTLSDVLARFEFRSVAREWVNERPAVVLEFRARPGKADLEGDKILRQLAGRLWIDEQERAVVRAEFHNTGKIKFALGLGASLGQLDARVEFMKVDDLWLPRHSETFVAGRLLVFKGFRQRTLESYDNYRRFSVETAEDPVQPLAN